MREWDYFRRYAAKNLETGKRGVWRIYEWDNSTSHLRVLATKACTAVLVYGKSSRM